MPKQPAFLFYTGDWIQDTRCLSLAAKGAWIDLLCAMWRSQSRGTLSLTWLGYSRLLGAAVEQTRAVIVELVDSGICDCISKEGEKLNSKQIVTCNSIVTLVNRRMNQEELNRENTRLRVMRHRQKKKCNDECNENVTTLSSIAVAVAKNKAGNKLPARPCPHKEIIEIYHEMLPELTHVLEWKGQREKNLATRWRENKERQNLEWWRDFFGRVKASPFLTGKVKDFKADLGWLVKYGNFIKVLEGKYLDKKNEKKQLNKQNTETKRKQFDPDKFDPVKCIHCKHHDQENVGDPMAKCNHPATSEGREKAMEKLRIEYALFNADEMFQWPEKFSVNWLIYCGGFER